MGGNKGYIVVTIKVHREDDQYVARCEELGVSTCAASLDAAFERIQEAISLYLDTLEEVGELERVFSERGVELIPGLPQHVQRSVCATPDEEIISLRSVPIPAIA